jgi:hypothetical protein
MEQHLDLRGLLFGQQLARGRWRFTIPAHRRSYCIGYVGRCLLDLQKKKKKNKNFGGKPT